MRTHRVRCLLMGGQACVLYGGAEFSRDIDLAVSADAENIARLQAALDELRAARIAVPPFELKYLEVGLAVHFRCRHPQAMNMRVDVMSTMRGVAPFSALWDQRTTLHSGGEPIEALALPDLVQSKKTQRDKDWPMIVRLLEANYFANQEQPTSEQIDFWLRELRTPSLLIEVAARFPEECGRAAAERDLLAFARAGDEPALQAALQDEQNRERDADRQYWIPLRKELERLRRAERERKKRQE